MMNGRGHLPTFLIVVVAIALMVAAWFTYLTFDSSAGKGIEQVSLTSRSLGFFEDYVRSVFNEAVVEARSGEDKCAIFKMKVAEHESQFTQAGNFFALVRNEPCDKLIVGDKLRIDGVFVSAEEGFNKFRREFYLEADLG